VRCQRVEGFVNESKWGVGAFVRVWNSGTGTGGPHSVRAQGLILRGFVGCLEPGNE
jgi:hypothetical protein